LPSKVYSIAQLSYQETVNVKNLALALAVKPLLTALGLISLIVTSMVLGTLPSIVNGLTNDLDDLVSFQGLGYRLTDKVI
jgi:hypothetical protein